MIIDNTWVSLFRLLRPIEFLVTVDHFPEWRRHIAWSKPSGKELKVQITQRFASSMVFMSLILGAELSVLFNSCDVCTAMRVAMKNAQYFDLSYWVGVVILSSVCVTILALTCIFTAWELVSSISDENMHCLIRSTIGQSATQLPNDLVVLALYLFALWVVLFLAVLLPGIMGILVAAFVVFIFFQVVITYSCFGRIVLHTGAMGKNRVLAPNLEHALLPTDLHACLVAKAYRRIKKRASAMNQYRSVRSMGISPPSSPISTPGEVHHKKPKTEGTDASAEAEKDEGPVMPVTFTSIALEARKKGSLISAKGSEAKDKGRIEASAVEPALPVSPPSEDLETGETTSLAEGHEENSDLLFMIANHRSKASRGFSKEWAADYAAREQYGRTPPARFNSSDEDESEGLQEDTPPSTRNNMLNRIFNFQPLAREPRGDEESGRSNQGEGGSLLSGRRKEKNKFGSLFDY